MSSLAKLKITNLRNIQELTIDCSPKFNLITGINGSGKTAVLEAIYILSTAKSFRCREIAPVVNYDSQFLTVYGETIEGDVLSVKKSNKGTQIHINQNICSMSSELTSLFPSQLVYQNIFNIIDAGSVYRRELLDWGLFHVEQSYLSVWKRYKIALKQRNALLQQQMSSRQDFVLWDMQISILALELDKFRQSYCARLAKAFQSVLDVIMPEIQCSLEYYNGWSSSGKEELSSVLCNAFAGDKLRRYTQFGAHQADLIIKAPHKKAKQEFSRGQQKMILLALKFAQASLLKNPVVYLLDDILAELDSINFNRVAVYLNMISDQIFFTATDWVSAENIIRNFNSDCNIVNIGESLLNSYV